MDVPVTLAVAEDGTEWTLVERAAQVEAHEEGALELIQAEIAPDHPLSLSSSEPCPPANGDSPPVLRRPRGMDLSALFVALATCLYLVSSRAISASGAVEAPLPPPAALPLAVATLSVADVGHAEEDASEAAMVAQAEARQLLAGGVEYSLNETGPLCALSTMQALIALAAGAIVFDATVRSFARAPGPKAAAVTSARSVRHARTSPAPASAGEVFCSLSLGPDVRPIY
mmetsp:Transcript_4965/g.12812  ORF Transcript_4965/g.12812 Transcript_4965/m.12812 type:complete len:229 (+) Transcript_4965:121-807(+)